MSKGQPIGIDFGTTKTLACRWDERSQRPVAIQLGRSRDSLPTSIHVDADGNFLFGDDAEDNRATEPVGYISRFKRDLPTNTPKHIHGRSFTPIELTSRFLAHIRGRIEEEALHGPVGHVVITVPALSGPAAKANLKKAAQHAGFADFELLDEPVAGGLAFLHDSPETVTGENFLIFDWGGGTLDLAVVRRKGTDISAIPELIGGDPMLGGEDIDDAVEGGVSSILKQQNRKELRSQPDEFILAALRAITAGKLLLSRKSAHTFRFPLGDGPPLTFEWTRKEFERYIQSTVDQAVSLTKRLFDKASAKSIRVDGVVLIGGSSEIPVVAHRLGEVISVKTLRYDHAQQAVALGAALWAHGSLLQETRGGSPPVDIRLILKTSKGNIEATIFASKVPMTAANFLNLAHHGYYDGIKFHRVIAAFMIQGGDPTGTGTGGPGYEFAAEIDKSLKHWKPGIFSMANADPGMNGSQFFITHHPTPHLDGKHAVFGEVTKGQDVVSKIAQGDKIYGIEILDSTDALFAAQKANLDKWNKVLGYKSDAAARGNDCPPSVPPQFRKEKIHADANTFHSPTGAALIGAYSGQCVNTTVQQKASMVLAITSVNGNEVTGEVALYGELGGGSRFFGTLNGSRLAFVTCTPDNAVRVSWIGTIHSEKIIKGTYTVIIQASPGAIGAGQQQGLWECERDEAIQPTTLDRNGHAPQPPCKIYLQPAAYGRFIGAAEVSKPLNTEQEKLAFMDEHILNCILDLIIENTTASPLRVPRLVLKRKGTPEPLFVALNDIPPVEKFVLNSTNLQGWVICPQDEVAVEFANLPGASFKVIAHPNDFSNTWFAEHPRFMPIPVFVTWRRGLWKGAVLVILNCSNTKLQGVAVATPKGKTTAQHDIDPGGTLEIGHMELSGSQNLQGGDLFEVNAPGFLPIWGMVLENTGGSLGGSTAATVLKAAGAIGLGALGAFLGS